MCLSSIKTDRGGYYIQTITSATKWCNQHLQRVKYKNQWWYIGYKAVYTYDDYFSSLYNNHKNYNEILSAFNTPEYTGSSIHESTKYLTGFHIFSNFKDAKNYSGDYCNVTRVLFRFPRIVGIQDYDKKNCIIADQMIVFNPKHKKLQNILNRNGL